VDEVAGATDVIGFVEMVGVAGVLIKLSVELSGVTQRVTRVSRSVTHIFFITLLRAHMREKKSHIITHSDISVTKICVKNMCENV